jgi:acetylornithine deacetylase/succinyl-diaminopimelate desuccinylase-like protein
VSLCLIAAAQTGSQPDWKSFDEETMRHFQGLLRFETMDPPGNEKPAADYLQQILEKEGIPTKVFLLEPNRPNVVARLKGNGNTRPLLIMGHTDVVNVDPMKWKFPPWILKYSRFSKPISRKPTKPPRCRPKTDL